MLETSCAAFELLLFACMHPDLCPAHPCPAWQVCPPSTRWLVVTNGDNEYTENFMQLVSEGRSRWRLASAAAERQGAAARRHCSSSMQLLGLAWLRIALCSWFLVLHPHGTHTRAPSCHARPTNRR